LLVISGGEVATDNGHGVSRRQMLRRVGFAGAAAAVGTSLVTTVVAPTAAWASGLPTGCSGCGKNSDCTSGHCCQSNAGKQCNQSCCVGLNNSCHFATSGTTLTCTVCVSQTGCSTCPCAPCPGASQPCCTPTC
jgi:hypothetical protein